VLDLKVVNISRPPTPRVPTSSTRAWILNAVQFSTDSDWKVHIKCLTIFCCPILQFLKISFAHCFSVGRSLRTALYARRNTTTFCASSLCVARQPCLLVGGLGVEDQHNGCHDVPILLRVIYFCGVWYKKRSLKIKTINSWCTGTTKWEKFVAAHLDFLRKSDGVCVFQFALNDSVCALKWCKNWNSFALCSGDSHLTLRTDLLVITTL
jgi:hypothetical protein